MPDTRTRYTQQYKAMAVLLTRHPKLEVQAVADALGIHPVQLTNWRRELADLSRAQLLRISKHPFLMMR